MLLRRLYKRFHRQQTQRKKAHYTDNLFLISTYLCTKAMRVCLRFSARHVCTVRYSQLEVQTPQCGADLSKLIRRRFCVQGNTPWLSIW